MLGCEISALLCNTSALPLSNTASTMLSKSRLAKSGLSGLKGNGSVCVLVCMCTHMHVCVVSGCVCMCAVPRV